MTRATRQRERPARRAHRVLALALAPMILLAPAPAGPGPGPAQAQEAQAGTTPVARMRAAQERTWGRIRLDFDALVTVAARAENGVLVIRFDRPVEIVSERIAEEIPSYVNQVRRDPDGTGLRMALSQNFSASVLPAGETVFVDLLPEAWRGMPPGLPEDVVAELARRAAAAEERFAAERSARREAMPTPMPVRVAELPGLTRLIFAAPEGVPVEARSTEDTITLFFDERLALEPERLLPTIPGIADVALEAIGILYTLYFTYNYCLFEESRDEFKNTLAKIESNTGLDIPAFFDFFVGAATSVTDKINIQQSTPKVYPKKKVVDAEEATEVTEEEAEV